MNWNSSRVPLLLLLAVGAAFLLLGWAPKADRFTWFMENLPVVLGVPMLVYTYRKFPFTNMMYFLIALHCLVLMIGGYWTYAEVPAGDWVKHLLHLSRNPYDRLGHLSQGFVPVLLFRELVFRKGILDRGPWSAVVLVLMVLGLSASYELLEWQTAVWTGASADAFLGAQGDPWDTQWDMACALVGGVTGLATLSPLQDRSIQALQAGRRSTPGAPGRGPRPLAQRHSRNRACPALGPAPDLASLVRGS